MNKRLLRSRKDRVIGGVCGGMAEYLNLDPTVLRLLFALLTLASGGLLGFAYLVLWLVVPEEGAPLRSEPHRAPAPPPVEVIKASAEPRVVPPSVKAPEPTVAEPVEVKPTPKPRRRDTRILGWILLAVGIYFLLQKIGLGGWLGTLWPVVLIVVGMILLWPFLRGR